MPSPPSVPESSPPDGEPPSPPAPNQTQVRFAESARGWHGIQLAVLGFIGICGLLWGAGDTDAPQWVRLLAGTVAAAAFVLALVSIYLVGGVAYPLRRRPTGPSDAAAFASAGEGDGGRRLRGGVWLTYLAVALVVAATLANWWPAAAATDPVEVTDLAGRTWCGGLVESVPGTVALDTADGPVTLRLSDLATVRTVRSCD